MILSVVITTHNYAIWHFGEELVSLSIQTKYLD